tara:strand:- start:145914 stop:146555 length:642 start_codon:yes stop_codon:yes gene_type:complete
MGIIEQKRHLIKKHSNVIKFADIQVDINSCVGIDEVGRGPLAGPVVAAAVVLGDAHEWMGLKDSKMLTPKQRDICATDIKKNALAWAIGRCEPEEIDQYNIFNASLLAMKRAFEGISLVPELVLVDGKYGPELSVQSYAIIKGDQHVPVISAASILAKVSRDLEMCELDESYPQYGFARHKGYPTTFHIDALRQYGPCRHHRRSFKPVASVLK